MATVKTLVLYLLVGFLFGAVIVSLVAPSYMQWDNTPRSGQALCPCGETTRDAATRLLTTQAGGGAVTGFASLILGVVLQVRKRKKAGEHPAAPAATA